MKAIFHVSREQLNPDGLSITDTRFLEQLIKTLASATEKDVYFRYTPPAEVQVIFELVAENIRNRMPVLVIEVEGQSYNGDHRYSFNLREMAERVWTALHQATDITKRLPDWLLDLHVTVHASSFGSVVR